MTPSASIPRAVAAIPLLCALCACTPDASDATTDGADASTTDASSTSLDESGGSSTSLDESGGSSTSLDDSGSGETSQESEAGSSSDESTTSADDDVCIPYCDVIAECGDSEAADCVEECQTFRRFREENFDAACQAATEASRSCVAMLTCEELDEYACDPTLIDEVEVCTASPLPQPGLQSFCTMVGGCTRVSDDECIISMLDYNILESYELDCVDEYEAVLTCIGGLTCEQYADEAMTESICAAEIAAVDAACPTFGQE